MNKGQTAIMLAAAWLLLILLLSGCGCGAPVWKAVPCTSEPADAEFYIINDQGFEVEGRYLLEAYLEVDSSGASFTFRGIFGRELLSGTEFNIDKPGRAHLEARRRQTGQLHRAPGRKGYGRAFAMPAGGGDRQDPRPGLRELRRGLQLQRRARQFCAAARYVRKSPGQKGPAGHLTGGLAFLFVTLSFCPSSDYRSAC